MTFRRQLQLLAFWTFLACFLSAVALVLAVYG